MDIENDNSCSWINDLPPRNNIKVINKNEVCDWLIVGAGYTGLSAAKKLGQLYPGQKIIYFVIITISKSHFYAVVWSSDHCHNDFSASVMMLLCVVL